MSVEMASLSAVVVLALVHLAAGATAALPRQWRPRALSAAAGIGACYVFLELMPDLARTSHRLTTDGADMAARAALSRVDRPATYRQYASAAHPEK